MTERVRLTLHNAQAGHTAFLRAWVWCKAMLIAGHKLTAEDWKDMATAALKRQRVVPGIDGGFVVLGQRTSKMTIAEMGELMDFLEALGAEHEVRFSAPEHREAA